LTFNTFLKTVNLALWQDWKRELFMERGGRPAPIQATIPSPEKKTFVLRGDIACVYDLPIDHPARLYMEQRFPNGVEYKNVFYTGNFKRLINEFYIPDKYAHPEMADPRIVFPLMNKQNELVGLQGRTIDLNNELRYATIKLDETDELSFGLETLDYTKECFAVEGIFDALSMTNCFAMLKSWINPGFVYTNFPSNNVTYIFDNEKHNKEIRKNYENIADNVHFGLFLWGNIKYKDLNEMMVKEGLSTNDVTSIINKGTVRGIMRKKMALSRWLGGR
jgi:hypothetical protein